MDLVAKYKKMLGVSETPKLKIDSRLGNMWNGYCRWVAAAPQTSTIFVHKRILEDIRTLERVLAHEMVHHWENMNEAEHMLALLRKGIKPESTDHGATWLKGAALVNKHMGAGFVTEKSDQDYVYAAGKKPYYLLIKPSWAYLWTVKVTPALAGLVEREKLRGARLIKTTDEFWARMTPKLGAKTTQYTRIPDGEHADKLKKLYEGGEK